MNEFIVKLIGLYDYDQSRQLIVLSELLVGSATVLLYISIIDGFLYI